MSVLTRLKWHAVFALLCMLASVIVWANGEGGGAQAPSTPRETPPELVEFKKRVDAFAALHKKLEATLPKLSKEATPEQIDKNQRALAMLVSQNRAGASQGDVFTAPGQLYIRALLKRLFANLDKRKLRESIQDENPDPRSVKLAVNSRYPDAVPLASMPPEVLQALPPLPDEIEYRFVGDSLILLDPHAHLVVDYIPGALPK